MGRAESAPNAARLTVRLRPRGHSDELLAFRDGVLLARVTAPPVDGRANKALCRLVADAAGVAPSRAKVVRGLRSREKVVEVEGLAPAELERALGRIG
jgi:uncharacterized protein YggU (UPF0235/DUF167 family)